MAHFVYRLHILVVDISEAELHDDEQGSYSNTADAAEDEATSSETSQNQIVSTKAWAGLMGGVRVAGAVGTQPLIG